MTPQEPNTRLMKAWTCPRYGGPEVLTRVALPIPIPGDDEILVRILATTVSSGDVRVRSLNLPRGFRLIGRLVLGLTGPRQPILGTDMAGTIAAVGKNVTAFRIGDEVVAFPGAAMKCHAEYRTISLKKPIAMKPRNLSMNEAASLPFGAMAAWHFLRKAQVKAQDRVLVIGASGAVGTAFVQLANQLGAEVTAVTSGRNTALVQALGAREVIDYTLEDFEKGSNTYDVIADTVGASSFTACCPLLNENGRYISVAGDLSDSLARSKGTKRSIGGPATERRQDFLELIHLAEQGILKPVVDRVFPFEGIHEAHAYVDTGRKTGSVVIEVQ